MSSIKFLGAASGIVTGSSYLLTSGKGEKILIDFGMFQGPKEIAKYNEEAPAFSAGELSGVILTHAHLDHCGRLPILVQKGFKGKVYMTEATYELIGLVLLDSANIALHDKKKKILYTKEDVVNLLKKVEIVDYHVPFQVGGFSIEMYDAGHILGSTSLVVSETLREGSKRRIVFSGDLGNSPEDIEKPTEFIDSGEVVIMESTYGDRVHPKEASSAILAREIKLAEESGGTVLIPAFSLERTQVILHMIDHLKKDGSVKNETAVYLDSPMAIGATDIYVDHPELFNEKMLKHAKKDDPFDFPGLKIVKKARDSKKIKGDKGAKVIIAGSGMMSGGRILQHAIDFLPMSTTRLVIVGFQARGTIGREIIDGARRVHIYGKDILISASLMEIHALSAHADQPRLLAWLRNIKGVKKVFLTHGEDEARQVLSERVKKEIFIQKIFLPKMEEEVEL